MVLPAIGSRLAAAGGSLAGRIGSSTGATAGAGLAGGMLVDDIPFIGGDIDPTEGSGDDGPFGNVQLALLFGIGLVVLLIMDDD